MKTYSVAYQSAVTRNHHNSACKTKAAAIREAKLLAKEGAKNVRVIEFNGFAKEAWSA